MISIADTLAHLESWYNEPSTKIERPRLLSKLALIELCGWLETEQDRVMRSISSICSIELKWTNEEIARTFGFDYIKHFRPMLAKLLGEHTIRLLEKQMDFKYSGDIECLRSFTADLWVKRCSFAHEDISSNIVKQQRFDAPSWSQNRQRVLGKILHRFESEALIIAKRLGS